MTISSEHGRRIIFATTFAGSFAMTFCYFSLYHLVGNEVWHWMGLGLQALTWLTIITSIMLIFTRNTTVLFFTKIEAATLFTVMLITVMSHQSGHSSPDELFIGFYFAKLFFLSLMQLTVIIWKYCTSAFSPPHIATDWLLRNTFLSMMTGWLSAILIWSFTIVPDVIAAAEHTALNAPYCIEANGKQARTKFDLTALRLHSPREDGFAFNFHGLLVMEDNGRRYYSWSYREHAFVALSEHTREKMHLDDITNCNLSKNFASTLRLF